MKPRDENLAAVVESETTKWSGLYRIGGIAALILIVYSLGMVVQLAVLGGQPATAAEAFDLLHHHRIVGLLRLDLPTIFILPVYYLLFLGLFAALHHTNPARAVLATSLVFVGVTLCLPRRRLSR